MSCWDSRGQRPAPLRGPGPPPPGLALSPNSCMTPGKLGTTLPESATFKQSAGTTFTQSAGTLPATLGMGWEALGLWGRMLSRARGSWGGSRPTRTSEADEADAVAGRVTLGPSREQCGGCLSLTGQEKRRI